MLGCCSQLLHSGSRTIDTESSKVMLPVTQQGAVISLLSTSCSSALFLPLPSNSSLAQGATKGAEFYAQHCYMGSFKNQKGTVAVENKAEHQVLWSVQL